MSDFQIISHYKIIFPIYEKFFLDLRASKSYREYNDSAATLQI